MQVQLKCEHRHWGEKYKFFWVLDDVRFVFSSLIVELYKWTEQIEEFWGPADTWKPYTGDSLSRDCQTAHHSQSCQLEEMSKNRGTNIFKISSPTKNLIMIYCSNAYHHIYFIKVDVWYHNNIAKYLWSKFWEFLVCLDTFSCMYAFIRNNGEGAIMTIYSV